MIPIPSTSPYHHPRFGNLVVFDLGASDRLHGHIRLQTLSDRGKDVGDVFEGKANPASFGDASDLIGGIGSQIAETRRKLLRRLGRKDTLKAVVGFVPGDPDRGFLESLWFLNDRQGNRLRDIDFTRLKQKLAADGVPLDPGFKVLLFNDAYGGAALAAAALAQDPRYRHLLKAGANITYMASGRGFGLKDIRCYDDDSVTLISGQGYNLKYQFDPGNPTSVAAIVRQNWDIVDDTSVPNLIRHFGNALGLPPEESKQLVRAANGRIVTRFAEARKVFPKLPQARYRQAADAAIDKYLESVAMVCFAKAMNGSTAFVLSGPAVRGIRGYLDQYAGRGRFASEIKQLKSHYPHLSGKRPIETLLLGRMLGRLEQAGKNAADFADRALITDIHIDNNMPGWQALVQASVERKHFPFGGYRIPLSVLRGDNRDLLPRLKAFKAEPVAE